jgi:hypothetical protein
VKFEPPRVEVAEDLQWTIQVYRKYRAERFLLENFDYGKAMGNGGQRGFFSCAVCVVAIICSPQVDGTSFNGHEHQHAGDEAWSSVYGEIKQTLDNSVPFENFHHSVFHSNCWKSGSVHKKRKCLKMPNGLLVSFGDIVALAGDFYGDPSAPISQAKNAAMRRSRFYSAYKQFSESTMSKEETPLILQLIKKEQQRVVKYLREKKTAREAYESLGLQHEMNFARVTRSDRTMTEKMLAFVRSDDDTPILKKNEKLKVSPKQYKNVWEKVKGKVLAYHALAVGKTADAIYDLRVKIGEYSDLFDKDARYLALAKVNFDHFLPNSKTVYKTGHELAIASALKARQILESMRQRNLFNAPGRMDEYNKFLYEFRDFFVQALALEGMANHFLTDMFAPGHLRTPRVALHNFCHETTGALLSKCSHDEDNKQGMYVKNELGETWFALGDSKYFDKENEVNRRKCKKAVVASVKEVLNAFKFGAVSIHALNKTKKSTHIFNNHRVIMDPLPDADNIAGPQNNILGKLNILKVLNTFSSRFPYWDYLDQSDAAYNSKEIDFLALRIAPSPTLSESLNLARPAMFDYRKKTGQRGEMFARRKDSNRDGLNWKYVSLGYIHQRKSWCELELQTQGCDIV